MNTERYDMFALAQEIVTYHPVVPEVRQHEVEGDPDGHYLIHSFIHSLLDICRFLGPFPRRVNFVGFVFDCFSGLSVSIGFSFLLLDVLVSDEGAPFTETVAGPNRKASIGSCVGPPFILSMFLM